MVWSSFPRHNGHIAPKLASILKVLLLAMLVIFLSSASLFAQGNAGRILGTVTDQTGGAIAGATVTVTDMARGSTRTLTTDASGSYNAPT